MTVADAKDILGGWGLGVLMVIAAGVFVWFKLWPWYIKRVEARDRIQDAKDKKIIEVSEHSAEAIERSVGAMDRLIKAINDQPMKQIVDLIMQHMDTSQAQHREIMEHLERK